MLIVSPSVTQAALTVFVGVAWLDLTSVGPYVWFSFAPAVGAQGRTGSPAIVLSMAVTLGAAREPALLDS